METQTPCWWNLGSPTPLQTDPREDPRDEESGEGTKRKRARQRQQWQQQQSRQPHSNQHPDLLQQQQLREPATDEAEFKVVTNKNRRDKTVADKVPANHAIRVDPAASRPSKKAGEKRKRPPRTQVVVLEKPADKSYADIVGEESLTFNITTRRAKSGNLVLETHDKDQADSLACILKRRFVDSRG